MAYVSNDRPLRRVVRRSHKGFVGVFQSRKAAGPIEFESLLERDFLYLMEVDPLVTELRAQPLQIKWTRNSYIHVHIPDFAVRLRTGVEIVEVKPAAKAEEPIIIERTAIVTELLRQQGMTYRMLTEAFIRAEPRLSNAKTLLHGLGHEPSAREAVAVVDLLSAEPQGLQIAKICVGLAAPPSFTNSIYAMVMAGQITLIDGCAPITAKSCVRLTSLKG